MKIAYFTDTYLPQINGVTNTISKLTDYLDKKNFSHLVLAPEYTDKKIKKEHNVFRFKSIKLLFYPECRFSIPNYNKLKKQMDKFKPDLIHLFTPFGIGYIGLKYARENNIPIVSSYTTNFDMYLKYYRLEIFEEPIWQYFKWFHSFCNINYCASNCTKDYLNKKDIHNIKMFSRGIDTSIFNPCNSDSKIRNNFNKYSEKIIFTYVGRMAPEKDLDILLESIKIVNSKYPDKTEFVFVGDGPYIKILKNENLKNIHFTGYLEGESLAKAYASSDVFVFPSSTETFGNVVLEAMASGLPVIGVNSGGVTENILNYM
jgi:glycosyltransferase involved in cell wall biosynthesis